jgi:polyether ionophore transport system ATP-binding protein
VSEYAIETRGLRKRFGSKTAVEDLSLAVRRGEVFGFLGPNGAGKTTSVKMLLGLVDPTSGSGSVLGAPIGDRRTRARLGFLPEHFRFQDWLTGRELLHLHARLLGLRSAEAKARTETLLQRVDLTDAARRPIRTYSKGMMQRVGLAQALVGNPELVFLDEPTSGLDPLMESVFQDCIDEFKDEGHSVLLSSHILAEVERLCDRVSIIRSGRTVESGTLAELRHLTRTSVAAELASPATGLDRLDGLHDLVVEDHRVLFEVDTEDLGPALEALGRFGIRTLTSQPPTLEALFLRHYGDRPDGEPAA